jgi:hypothetical protein
MAVGYPGEPMMFLQRQATPPASLPCKLFKRCSQASRMNAARLHYDIRAVASIRLKIPLLSHRRCILRAIESDRVIVDERGSRAGNQSQGEFVQPFRFGTWPSTCLDTF